MKLEKIENVVARLRDDLEAVREPIVRIRDDVGELHERFMGMKEKVPWTQGEALQSLRRDLGEWALGLDTGEVKR